MKNRFGFKLPFGPLLIFLGSFLTFFVPLIQGKTLGPWSQIRHLAPWNGPAPSRPWDVLQMDSVLQFFGWRQQVFHSWHQGIAPWWNPYILNGTPLLANSQSGGLYPLHILIGVLGLPTGLGIMVLAILHMAWAGLGCYALVRVLGGSQLGSTFSGAAFSTSAFLMSWAPLSSVVETVSWIPWCLLCAHLLVTVPSKRLESGFWLGICASMMILAGHLQFAFYGFIATLLWLITAFLANLTAKSDQPSSKEKSSLLLAGLAIAIVVMAAGSSLQLLPVLRLGQQSHRQAKPTSDGYSAYISGADKWTELPSLASSSLLGTPNQGVGSDGNTQLQAYWPAYVYRGADFAETAFSFGPLVFFALFLGYGSYKNRQLSPVIAIGGLGALLAFGTPLNALFYYLIPGWAATGSPGRAGCLLVLAGCLASGLALTAVEDRVTKKNVQIGLAALAISLLVGIAILNLQGSEVWNPVFAKLGILGLIGPKVLVGAIASFAFAGGFALILLVPIEKKLRCVGTVGLCFLQPLVLYPVLFFGHPSLPIQQKPTGRVAVVMGDWSLLTSPSALAPPNTLALSGIDTVGGYDSLIRKEAQARLDAIDQGSSSPPENGNMMIVTPQFDPQALADAGVTEVWSTKLLTQIHSTPQQTSFGYIYPLAGPGRASTPNGPAKVIGQNAVSVTVQATGPGPLTLRDDLQHDWIAEASGHQLPINWTPWPTVTLPSAGIQTVTFVSTDGQKAAKGAFLNPALFALVACIVYAGKRVQQNRSRQNVS